jgi:hypothetical protein
MLAATLRGCVFSHNTVVSLENLGLSELGRSGLDDDSL